MKTKKHAFGLWLMMKLFEKHFEELSVSQMKEFVNVAAAAAKNKECSERAAQLRRFKAVVKRQNKEEHRETVSHDLDDLMPYLENQREQVAG